MRGEPVHTRGVAFDERLERSLVAASSPGDEVDVGQLPVREKPRKRTISVRQTGLGARDFLRGRKVFVDGRTGTGVGIDRSGRFEVDLEGKRRTIESGELLFE